jgi:hypothetical protein
MFERNGHTNNAKFSQGFASGAHRVPPIKVKVRRTYGWLCPYEDYRSNRWSNAQRHIDAIHEGTGNPVDSRTGETRDQKIANALNRSNMPNILSDYRVPHLSVTSPDRSNEQFGARVFSSLMAGNFPGYVNSVLNKPNNEKPVNINVHRDIYKDSYHDPPDYVDQLAKFDPAMAYWKKMRTQFKY